MILLWYNIFDNSMQIEVMQAVSFMYMRPPGYNPESARAAEIADERKSEHVDSEINTNTNHK
jgi:hypothetical protein